MADMAELPTGTVTFLFTDIEGSTKLLQRVGGERYGEIRADHERLLRQAWDAHQGHEVDTQGDAFFVAFPRATDALAAAAQAQRATLAHAWPGGEQVRVRMGLHTGAGIVSHDHYVGLDVNRAARICAAGHGGQVLLSQATRDQVAKELVSGQGIRDLGKHRLKDLPRREEIYQLTLPGMPTSFPPLKTLDAWPGYRADLVSVLLLSAALLAVVGLLLPLLVPVFPRGIGLVAAAIALLLVLGSLVARPVRRSLASQWRSARKPFAGVTSTLLCLVVVTTTLFITKPPLIIKPPHLYDFTYTYHRPTHTGGNVTIGLTDPLQNANIYTAQPLTPFFPNELLPAESQSCLVNLKPGSLEVQDYRPDLCTEVPTIANQGESLDDKTTIIHLDPRARWSDGVPITADDLVFSNEFLYGGFSPTNHARQFIKVDAHTVKIQYAEPFAAHLAVLTGLILPLHYYATGKYKDEFIPSKVSGPGVVNSALMDQEDNDPTYSPLVPVVENGPYLVQPGSFIPGKKVTLVPNPYYVSNYFHKPTLNSITFVSERSTAGKDRSAQVRALAQAFRQGTLDEVEGLAPFDLPLLKGIPKAKIVTSPLVDMYTIGFNQRTVAPNAKANGGGSIFTNFAVRKAFFEAFDRCGALRAQLGIPACNNPNLVTNEMTAPSNPDYDRTVPFPAYNPTDAAKLLKDAGFPVVDGVRRYPDGKTPIQLTIALSPDDTAVPIIVQRMQADYERNLGITVNLVPFDSVDSYFTEQQSGAFDLTLYVNSGTANPAGNVLFWFGHTDIQDIPPHVWSDNWLGIIDSHIITADNLANQIQDPSETVAIFRNLQPYLAGQYYMEPVFIAADIALLKPTLCNFKKYPLAGFNTWNMSDWYVAPSCPS
jgi:ABC-type transport system substrate-binding protein/class 3 adenylate cyclase